MGSGNPPAADENGAAETSSSSVVGNQVKKRKSRDKLVPLRIHKSEREKLKREHLNHLFLHLAAALELSPPNNGKAAVVAEANRVIREALLQVESLKTENAALLSESEYASLLSSTSFSLSDIDRSNQSLFAQVGVETAELRCETAVLGAAVESLLKEVRDGPYWEIPVPKFGDPKFESDLGQQMVSVVGPVYVIPVEAPSYVDPATALKQPTPNLSRPHARYPSDSWPSDVLRG